MNIVKTEIAYSAHTHQADKIARLHPLGLNCIPHKEKVVHLTILLEDDNVSMCTVADLPTNGDFISALERIVFPK